MQARLCRLASTGPLPLLLAALLPLAPRHARAQDLSITRLPQSTDMTVRLENLTTHNDYEASGNSYFIVPPGRYSIQLLRNGAIAYQEAEFLSPESPGARTVNPSAMEIVVGLSRPNPQFEPTVCAALQAAAQLAIAGYGLHVRDVQRRIASADPLADPACSTRDSADAMIGTLTGSYGVTALGMIGLAIDYAPLAPQRRPRNHGNSPIYTNPDTQRLGANQQPGSNLTPSLVADLKVGISDVAFDDTGKPFVVCAAIDANTPLFCDSNGFATETPAIARLRGLYRFSIKTTPVDSRGVEDDHWVTFADEDEYQPTRQKLVTDIEAIRVNLAQAIAQAQAGSVTAASRVPGEQVRYYQTADLVALIASTQAAIDEALRNVTLQPLRAHFPRAIAQLRDPQQPAVRDTEAQSVFHSLSDAVASITHAADDLGVDLVFRTTPVETADSHLSFEACNRCFTIASQGGEHRFYRGRYYIRASRDGYVPFEGWLDLVADPRTILECEMVRIHRGSAAHSTCALKVQ